MKIRIGIVGYGNLGRGAEYAVMQNKDMELAAVFSRRVTDINPVTPGVKVFNINGAEKFIGDIDVMLLCGSSAAALPEQTPAFAKMFNVVDSFDTHAKIPEHFAKVDAAAKAGGRTAFISAGWDPGLFSVQRVILESVLPVGRSYSFYGKGVSQGHSDAIRQLDGVLDARQYSVPVEASVTAARNGENPELTARQLIRRDCFVVAKDGADKTDIERKIKSMLHYFADYDTTVTFISEEELKKNHAGLPHGGFVVRGGRTGENESSVQVCEFGLRLDSNPEFTASILTACARATYRLNKEGARGCVTVFDVPPAYYLAESAEELRRRLL